MKTIIIILAFLLLVNMLLITFAPYGYEDKDGFHYGEKNNED